MVNFNVENHSRKLNVILMQISMEDDTIWWDVSSMFEPLDHLLLFYEYYI
jgi:hypothetical protein